jgi:transglutaminase-like putative cysteine protease
MNNRIRTFTIFAFCVAIFSAFASNARADDAPGWLKQAAAASVPTYEKNVPAVVLHDEEQVTLGSDGKLVTVDNYAVRMLTREGKRYAIARADYLVSSGKVRDIMAWIVRPDGSTKYYDKKFILDLIADPDDVYNEGRFKIIDASGDVDAGYVFGYTTVSEDTPLFYQDRWSFQGRLPTLVSRYSLSLPSGWKATSVTFNAADIKPLVNGSSYTWEMRDLAPIPPEPMSLGVTNLAPRIAINYGPENSSQAASRTFANWTDVSVWGTSLHDPEVIVDDNVAAKARELTANATTELDKIRAIGNYVQNLQYIAIDIGVGYGNGYRPRPSSLVLGRGYGDCKDKANLMRALLRAVKIEAYPIAIFSGDPTFVRAEFASPQQFNHCIIAIKVSDATKAPTVIEHEKLGRLLIFDATDPYTSVGDLPDEEQGSFALLMAGDKGGLARMPVTPPDTDQLQRNVEVTLSGIGEIKGVIRERAHGQVARLFRGEFRELAAPDYRKALEGWLTHGATGAALDTFQTKDVMSDAAFDLDVNFSASRYAQLMRGNLLVFKPVIVGRRKETSLTESKRSTPVEINSSAMSETATFTLPEGFDVDEMPPATNFETSFGKYTSKCEVKDNKLLYTRVLTLNRTILPVDKYSMAKDFFAKIRDAEQVPVVLVKK